MAPAIENIFFRQAANGSTSGTVINLNNAPPCLTGVNGFPGYCKTNWGDYVDCLSSYTWATVPDSCFCNAPNPLGCAPREDDTGEDCYYHSEAWYLNACGDAANATRVDQFMGLPECAKNCVKLSALREGCLSLLERCFCVIEGMTHRVTQCVQYSQDCVSAGVTLTSNWAKAWYGAVCENPANVDYQSLLKYNTTDATPASGSRERRKRCSCCASCCHTFGIIVSVVVAFILVGLCCGGD